jgi:hypothetical protein
MYDDTKQQSLFAKFDCIVIDDAATDNEKKLNIAGDDLRHCKTVQKEFDVIMENLRDFKTLCETITKEADQSGKYQTFEMMSKSLLYFPGADFEEKEKEAKKSFIFHINHYFSQKYNLKDMDCSDLLRLENLHYNHIIEKLFAEFGDIIKRGVSNLVDDFRRHFVRLPAYEPKPPKLSRNKINLYKRYWYDANFDHTEFYFESNNDGYRVFCRALLYFDTGDITAEKTAHFPETSYKNLVDFSKTYELGLEKIEGVKFYKNGRVDLVFNSGEYAGEFFEMFGLSNPIDNRRK